VAYTPELCSGVVLRTTPVYGIPDSSDDGIGLPDDMGQVARAGTKVSGLVSLLVNTRTGSRLSAR
jgi:hypothetical protein